ncbi:hypothetical protein EJB05_36700, partial [Eragrostis curvula]
MASMKINVTVAAVAVIFLSAAFHPCDASTNVKYTPTAPPPPPRAYPSPSPTPAVRPVIIVEGIIYCKSCKLKGYNRNMDASPLPNATASLVCYGNKKSNYRELNVTSTPADKNGYFIVMMYEVAMFHVDRCMLYLRSSPTSLCAAPFVPAHAKLSLPLEKEPRKAPLPKGALGAYHSKSALMYAPGNAGKCPPY